MELSKSLTAKRRGAGFSLCPLCLCGKKSFMAENGGFCRILSQYKVVNVLYIDHSH